jgi:hypothetical protein
MVPPRKCVCCLDTLDLPGASVLRRFRSLGIGRDSAACFRSFTYDPYVVTALPARGLFMDIHLVYLRYVV